MITTILNAATSCQTIPTTAEPILTPTPTIDPSIPKPELLEAAAQACQRAWILPISVDPDRANTTGPTLTLISYAEDQTATWGWAGHQFDSAGIETPTGSELNSLICIKESLTQEGYYENIGVPALSRHWGVRWLSWPGGLVMNEADFHSQPPSQIKVGQSGKALPPIEDLFAWISDTSNGRALLVWRQESARRDLIDMQLLPDQKRLAFLENGIVRLLEASTGNEIHTFSIDNKPISHFGFSADGNTLFSFSSDMINIWDVENGQARQSFPIPDPEMDTNGLREIHFTPDGRILVLTTSHQNTIKLWDVVKAEALSTMELRDKFNPGAVIAELSPDAKIIVTTVLGTDGIVKVWDASTSQELQELQTSIFTGVEFSPNGTYLAVEGLDENSIWELATGTLIATFPRHGVALRFSPDEK